VVREHVPHGPCSLALERSKHTVELKRTREKADEQIAQVLALNGADSLSEQSDAKQLASVEEFVPVSEAISTCLIRVVARRDLNNRVGIFPAFQRALRPIESPPVIVRCWEISLLAVCQQDELRVQAVRRRLLRRSYRFRDVEGLRAALTLS